MLGWLSLKVPDEYLNGSARSFLAIFFPSYTGFKIISFTMATRFTIFVALMILSSLAMAQLDDVGTFDMTSNESGNIDVHCYAYAGQQQILDFGYHNLLNGNSWMNEVAKGTTTVQCTFNLAGFFKQNLPLWVKDDPAYTLPVACSDCYWIVDPNGFSILNPTDRAYIPVASWIPE